MDQTLFQRGKKKKVIFGILGPLKFRQKWPCIWHLGPQVKWLKRVTGSQSTQALRVQAFREKSPRKETLVSGWFSRVQMPNDILSALQVPVPA